MTQCSFDHTKDKDTYCDLDSGNVHCIGCGKVTRQLHPDVMLRIALIDKLMDGEDDDRN